nr:alpha/beta fold hydrolase [Actinomycetota bacterium]
MKTFERAGLSFDVVDSGPPDGPPVILLHGFPANPRSWERVTPALVGSGHRVLVPAQRGYSPGARPPRRRDYRVGELVDDVLALADQAGLDRFAVAGHDWGAVVAWSLAARCPERISAVAALSVPHPGAVRQALAGTQLARSWYMVFFQLPALPERILSAPLAARILERSGLDAELAVDYVNYLRAPGALTAAVNWYRALPFEAVAGDQPGPVRVPTLYVWSTNDPFLGRRGAE